jgi:hypothetical protein
VTVDLALAVDVIFHHLDVTPDGLILWYCTKPSSTSQPGAGTQPPIHPTNFG